MAVQRRLLVGGTATTAVGVIGLLFGLGGLSSSALMTVLAFGTLILLAENSALLFPSSAAVSPSLVVVMASLPHFDANEAVLGASLVAAFSLLDLKRIQTRRWETVLFNGGQITLSAAAAAAVFSTFGWNQGPLGLIAALLATGAYGLVNTGLIVPGVCVFHNMRPAVVWADMRPAMPNYLAFGLLGLLLGQLSAGTHPIVLVLLLVPMLIGRYTFASLLKLRDAHEATIGIFIRLIEAKDPYTAGHTERVAKYAQYIAEEVDMPPSRYEHLRHSALMHDVGKLAVPNRLLNKPGRLTEEEFAVVRQHNDVCIDILGRVDFMKSMAIAASDKHARFEDGSGDSPTHELVLEAHIVAVADAFDAITSTRSYRKALPQDVAFEELRKCAGSQFNPECVEALIRAIEARDEHYGAGYEEDAHDFAVAPPEVGVGSAGLGDLAAEANREPGASNGPFERAEGGS